MRKTDEGKLRQMSLLPKSKAAQKKSYDTLQGTGTGVTHVPDTTGSLFRHKTFC